MLKNRTHSTLAKYNLSLPDASAGRAHYGRLIKQCNTYLKWAFIACPGRQAGEAANVIVRHRHHPNWREKYVAHLY